MARAGREVGWHQLADPWRLSTEAETPRSVGEVRCARHAGALDRLQAALYVYGRAQGLGFAFPEGPLACQVGQLWMAAADPAAGRGFGAAGWAGVAAAAAACGAAGSGHGGPM